MQQNIARTTRRKEATRIAYNRMSGVYNLLSAIFEKKHREAGLEKLAVQSGETVLEIGFGTGRAIVAMARAAGDTGKVYGIDISDKMLRKAGRRVRKAGLSKRVVLQRGDAAQLSFKENFFDTIFMSFTLESFDTPEIPIILKECKRVLKNDGRLCVVALSKKDKDTFMVRFYERVHRMFPRYVDCRPIFVRQTLEESGFLTIDVTEMPMWKLPVAIVLARKATTAGDTQPIHDISPATSDKAEA
jgi:demethylmenaquinone methyltransferase/2-methoxy-6-polyprenyl-1,4-benzoquinol methylase